MMQTNTPRCRHHSDAAAHWHCPDCRLDLCTDCKPYAERLSIRVVCPLCAATMRERRPAMSARSELLALFKPPALWPHLLLAGLLALTAWLLPAGPARLAASLPVLAALGVWLGLVARSAAEHRPRAPSARDLLDLDELELSLRTLGLALPFAAVGAIAFAASSIAFATASTGLLAAVLPAGLAALVMHDRLGAAFRPGAIRDFIAITRGEYLPAALASLAAIGMMWPVGILPAGSPYPAAGAFAAGWLAVAGARLTGRVVHRHGRLLGYHGALAPVDRPRRPPPSVHEPAMLAADSDSLRAAGRTRAARLHLGAALTRYPDDERLTRRFDRLIHETAGKRDFRNHLARRLKRLVDNGQFAPATDLWQRFSPELGNWMPRHATTRYQLGLELDHRGEHATAFRMLIGLSPEESGFEQASEAWLESARILADHLGDPDKARELSQFVAARDPAVVARWRERRGSLPGEPATARAGGTRMESAGRPDDGSRAALVRSGEIG